MSSNVALAEQSSPEKTCAIVIGAGGGIGSATVDQLKEDAKVDKVFAISRHSHQQDCEQITWLKSDSSEHSISRICHHIEKSEMVVKYVVIALGTLHDAKAKRMPEKRIEQLSKENLEEVLEVNTLMPILWLQKITQLFGKHSQATIAVLSARVGSISDNRLGGWYSYRASKAALNMLLKTLAIEYERRFPSVKLIAFHPGTTDTELSKPFQSAQTKKNLLEPSFTAKQLATLLSNSNPDGELSFVDWKHEPIDW